VEALVSIVRRELAVGAAKVAAVTVPFKVPLKVTVEPLIAVTYAFVGMFVPVTVCPTTKPTVPPTPSALTASVLDPTVPEAVRPENAVAGWNIKRPAPLVTTVPDKVATPPVTSTTVSVPVEPNEPVEFAPSLTVIPGSTNAPAGSVI
jgi:hypothetical protein